MFKALLERLVRRGKSGSAFPPAAELGEAASFAILLDAAEKWLRGECLRPWLGSSRGGILVGRGVKVSQPRLIHVGHGFVIEDGAEMQGLASGGLRFGNNVTIGRHAQIRPSGYYGRDVGVGLAVGDDSNIGPMAYIGASGGITIGNKVLMGPGVTVLSEDHRFDESASIKSQGVVHASTRIEDDVWIGARAVILGGTTIGKGVVVAAGAVVTGDVEPYCVVGGVPARVIKRRTAPESKP